MIWSWGWGFVVVFVVVRARDWFRVLISSVVVVRMSSLWVRDFNLVLTE